MANYPVAAGERGVRAKALAASTVDTVTFAYDCVAVEVITDGTSAVYFTTDGSTPTVAGNSTEVIPAGALAVRDVPVPSVGNTVVKLISSGTPTYSVTGI